MTTAILSEPFEPTSRWVPLHHGWITATGAPSRQRMDGWRARGATDVLTLQRANEMQLGMHSACIDNGLQWHHLPLSGRRMEGADDRASLARLPTLVSLWNEPRRVVVHCSAGLHRTGAVCYLLFRLAGHSREAAIEHIREARPLTADELCRKVRSGVLIDQMDSWLAQSRVTQPTSPA